MGNFVPTCFSVFPKFFTTTIFHFWHLREITFVFSPTFYHVVCSDQSCLLYRSLPLYLDTPSHLHLQVIPNVAFSKDFQSLPDWLLCLARASVSVCLS